MSKVFYHLTNKAKFKFDPKYRPANNTTLGGDWEPGIFVSKDPEPWINGHNYRQPFVVQISAPEDILTRPGVMAHGYGGEVYIPAAQYPSLHIDRVVPTDVIAREQYGSHGWIEGDTGVEFDTRKPLPERPTYHEFDGWHYTGPDVREMPPEQVRQLKGDARKSLRMHSSAATVQAALRESVTAALRRCERCGQAMPPRMHRQTDAKGRKVCESCARSTSPLEGWNVTYASQALSPDLMAEFGRREAQTLASLNRVARLRTVAHDSGDGETIYHCLSGDTRYLTPDGVRTLAETAGTVQRVLTGGAGTRGRWVEAIIHEFGPQPLLRVTLRRNRRTKVVRATAEHDWLVTAGPQRDQHRRVKTTDLRPGHRLPHLRATRFDGEPSREGVRLGFVYGDGSIVRTAVTTHGAVTLWGAKRDLTKLFDETCTTRSYEVQTDNGVPGVRYTSGMTGYTKTLPSPQDDPGFLLGWLMGYFAADGSVANGKCSLASASLETLERVRDLCTVLGIGTYAPTTFLRTGYGSEPTPMHEMAFSAADLGEGFFLRDDQRRAARAPHHERFGWTVVSVEDHGEVETVYCPRVPDTESFVLEDNIHLGQCPFCGSGAVTGSPQGTVSCDFCHSRFTVQVQPEFDAMPQTVNGQPYNIPGMPGGGPDAGAARPVEEADQDAAQQDQPDAPAPLDQEVDEQDPGNLQPQVTSYLLVQGGLALPKDKALQRLALRHAGGHRDAVLAQVREENAR